MDGLKGFPEVIAAVFSHTSMQLCIVHMVGHSLNYVSWKRRAEVASDLTRPSYASASSRPSNYWPIGQSWRRSWTHITLFFGFSPESRTVIYTTNAIDSVNV